MKTLWILTLVAMGALVSQAQAGHHCGCPSCGCQNIKKVCRLVPEFKKTTTFCYDCKCEDFCLPGPSPCCGKKCVPNTCSTCFGTGCHKEHIYGKPCFCGHIRTRKVLIKIPVTKETKVWVCKVERVCCGCGCAQLDAKATTEARSQEIMTVSAQQPIVLDEHSSFEEGVAVVPATIDEHANAPEAAAVQQTSAIEAPAADQTAGESRPKSFLEKLLGK
jgi:hypothetical protein